jgi:hypothetical protein
LARKAFNRENDKRQEAVFKKNKQRKRLGALATDAAGQLNVLGHDSNTLSMNGAEVGVLKETREVSFCSFLKSTESRALEAQIPTTGASGVPSDLANKALERELADEELRALLVAADLTEGHGSRAEPLFDALRRALSTSRLAGGDVLARGLASSRPVGNLLRVCHSEKLISEPTGDETRAHHARTSWPECSNAIRQETLGPGKNVSWPTTFFSHCRAVHRWQKSTFQPNNKPRSMIIDTIKQFFGTKATPEFVHFIQMVVEALETTKKTADHGDTPTHSIAKDVLEGMGDGDYTLSSPVKSNARLVGLDGVSGIRLRYASIVALTHKEGDCLIIKGLSKKAPSPFNGNKGNTFPVFDFGPNGSSFEEYANVKFRPFFTVLFRLAQWILACDKLNKLDPAAEDVLALLEKEGYPVDGFNPERLDWIRDPDFIGKVVSYAQEEKHFIGEFEAENRDEIVAELKKNLQ